MTQAERHIAIEPFKRSEYDRGTKVVLVDGENWGWIEAQFHGCHGPSYHVHDHHGPVAIDRRKSGPRNGEDIEAKFWPKGAKAYRIENIGKPDDQKIKPVSTEDQLREHVRELIERGHLRSPATREKEIADANEQASLRVQRAEQKEAREFRKRATAIVEQMQRGACGEHLINEIMTAMKWARTR